MLTLKVVSKNPLQLTDGDKLFLTEDFIIFNNSIDKNKLSIGDKLQAQTFNDGQTYYIVQEFSSKNNIAKDNPTLIQIQQKLIELEQRITRLEGGE